MSGATAGASPALEILPAETWAAVVAERLVGRLEANPGLRVCLPTGHTPAPLYDRLGELDRAEPGRWARATVVLLDEFTGLPQGDPSRFDRWVRSALIDRLAPPPRFIPIDVDGGDMNAAVARHDAAAMGLDIAVVGLGLNGHIGLNEPGSSPADETRVVRLAASSQEAATTRYGATRTPTAGITIGLARLLEAGEIWLLVTGERKAGVLRRALREPEGSDCPASYLRRHPRLVVFADEAAATLL